jgi:predicted DNA-binding transcriptional regulator AlpA
MLQTAQARPPWEGVQIRGPMHRMHAVARYLGIGRSTAYEMIQRGELPRPIALTPGVSVIPESWLEAVVAARATAVKEPG